MTRKIRKDIPQAKKQDTKPTPSHVKGTSPGMKENPHSTRQVFSAASPGPPPRESEDTLIFSTPDLSKNKIEGMETFPGSGKGGSGPQGPLQSHECSTWFYSSVLEEQEARRKHSGLTIKPFREEDSENILDSQGIYGEVLHEFYNNAPIGIFQLSCDGRRINLNRELASILGYQSQKELTSSISSVSELYLDPEEPKKSRDLLMEKGRIRGYELKLRKNGGDAVWVMVYAKAITGKMGHVEFFEGFAVEITRRKKFEAQILQSKNRHQFIMDKINFVVTLIDSDYNVLAANALTEKWFNRPVEDFVGKKCYQVLRNREDSCPDCPGTSAMRSGQPEDTSTKLELDCGKEILTRIKAFPFNNSRGEPVGFTAVVEDISQAKVLEDQLQHSERLESIGTLAGGIAHDFNNILSSIIGYTELVIEEMDKDSSGHANLNEVLTASQRARDLIQRILAFSRQAKQETKPVKVKSIVEESLKLLRASLPTTIKIRGNLESHSVIMADPTQINQVVMNLSTNAGQAMKDHGGTLSVSLKDRFLKSDFTDRYENMVPGKYIELQVSDTGHGIQSDIQSRIFNPFFTTKAKGEGTGLGLSMVHGIVSQLGGGVSMTSKPDMGSVFQVFLPTIESAVDQQETKAQQGSCGNERILFVDDEPSIANIEKLLLERMGYRVEIRTSSFEALELFRARPRDFDLLITDMTMPGMTGDKLALKVLGIRPDLPIILCTGFSQGISEEKAKEIGIRAFVTKPILKQNLAETIRRVIDNQ